MKKKLTLLCLVGLLCMFLPSTHIQAQPVVVAPVCSDLDSVVLQIPSQPPVDYIDTIKVSTEPCNPKWFNLSYPTENRYYGYGEHCPTTVLFASLESDSSCDPLNGLCAIQQSYGDYRDEGAIGNPDNALIIVTSDDTTTTLLGLAFDYYVVEALSDHFDSLALIVHEVVDQDTISLDTFRLGIGYIQERYELDFGAGYPIRDTLIVEYIPYSSENFDTGWVQWENIDLEVIVSCSDPCVEEEREILSIAGEIGCDEEIEITYGIVSTCDSSTINVVTVALIDTIPPEIICPADYTVQCFDDVGDDEATATDNCGIPIIPDPEEHYQLNPCDGLVERIFTATDDCGNTASCTQVIRVEDTIPPEWIYCADDITINCWDPIPYFPPVAEDDCAEDDAEDDDLPVWIDVVLDTLGSDIVITNSFVAYDPCGNVSDTCRYTITITGGANELTLQCPEDVTLACIDEYDNPTVTATGNCGPVTYTIDPSPTDPECNTTIVRRFIVEDASGARDTCDQLITFITN